MLKWEESDFDPLQRRIFVLSYITYASYYLTRLNFSVALPGIAGELGYSKFTLGLVSGAFSISYAIGQFVNGQIADSFGARKLISIGLIFSAILNLLFGYSELPIVMMTLWALNGYAQSTGWPSVVKIISDWFRKGPRGTIGGLFGTCFLVGSIIAWASSGYITDNFGWRMTFQIPSFMVVVFAFLFYIGVSDRPEGNCKSNERVKASRSIFRLRRILLSRRFVTIAAAYTLLQFVRSGFTLWAPSYIFETYGLSLDVASYGAALIPLGGITGSIISGWLSDRLKGHRRAPIMTSMTLFLTILLVIMFYGVTLYGLHIGMFLLFLSGLALYGPHVIMVTTIPMDFGERYGAAGIAGFIDGIGYIGTAFADPFIGWTVDVTGWNEALAFWSISSLSTALLTLTLWADTPKEEAQIEIV